MGPSPRFQTPKTRTLKLNLETSRDQSSTVSTALVNEGFRCGKLWRHPPVKWWQVRDHDEVLERVGVETSDVFGSTAAAGGHLRATGLGWPRLCRSDDRKHVRHYRLSAGRKVLRRRTQLRFDYNSTPFDDIRQMLTDFQSSFTFRFSSDWALRIPSPLKRVATLPCETLMFENWSNYHVN